MPAGPILVIDKSALQAISVDESVMLDTFFLTNMTPTFFIEALGDLEKIDRKGRTPEFAVAKDLAAKVPDQPHPNVFYRELAAQNLSGYPVAMTGQIIISGGVPKRDERGGVSLVMEEAPEAEMVRRWQAGEFEEAERRIARAWREAILGVSFKKKIDACRSLFPSRQKFGDLRAVKAWVDEFLLRRDESSLSFAVRFLGLLSEHDIAVVNQRHGSLGRPTIAEYAPYAAFVLSIQLVFYVGMATDVIRSVEKTNLIDLSYLYYLPFCMVFASRDKLHRQLAPLFLREDQRFVWGDDLKADLKRLNEYYAPRRDEMGRMGLLREHRPPREASTVVAELWDALLQPDAGEPAGEAQGEGQEATRQPAEDGKTPEGSDALLQRINRILASAETLPTEALLTQPDSVVSVGRMPLRRGSWHFYPQRTEAESVAADRSGDEDQSSG